MGRQLRPRYGQVILVSGYLVLTAFNWTESNRKNIGERSEPSGSLGRGKWRRSLETCLWCRRSMIPDSRIMLWLVKCLHIDRFAELLTASRSSMSRSQYSEKKNSKHGFRASNTKFFAMLFAYPWSVPKRKTKHSQYWAFLILSHDKLRSHLQSDWLINRCSKMHIIVMTLLLKAW